MQVVAPPVYKCLISLCCSLTICNPHSPDLPGVFRHPFPKNLWGEFFLHPRLPHSAALGGLGALTLQHAHNNCSETPTCWQGLKCNLRPSRPFPAPLRPRPLATVRRGALGPSAPPQRQGSERAQVSWVRCPLAFSHRPSTVSHKTLGSTAQPRARPGLLGAAVGTPKKGVWLCCHLLAQTQGPCERTAGRSGLKVT